MTTRIVNPILPGFNPDPSLLFVDGTYYIATSTFEWFPGVQIHKSTDLVNWELYTRPLTSVTALDMIGNNSSDGIWAPCLSYNNGTYYLIYTNVRSSQKNPFKDTLNYLITANDLKGPWSDPIFLNSSGFDPSLFHDNDGRKWLVNMEWDYRKMGRGGHFSGILLQEYDEEKKKLIGTCHKIFKGSACGITEGPHLYKRNGYYYLIVAEGGTGYQHSVTVARSQKIEGPYELHPNNPILTSWEWDFGADNLGHPSTCYLQKAGHASICQGKHEEWYLAHLCGRPIKDTMRCVLGRETSLQQIEWKEDDWFYLKQGGNHPAPFIDVEGEIPVIKRGEKIYHFQDNSFWKDFQTLRVPLGQDDVSLEEREGFLAVRGRESIYSRFHQSLLARRQEDFCFDAAVSFIFTPESFMHMAGLNYRYNEDNQYYLFMSYEEEKHCNSVNLVMVNDGTYTLLDQVLLFETEVESETEVEFKVEVRMEKAQFYYCTGKEMKKIGPEVDTTILSDEYARPGGFTGAFVGISVQDLKAQEKKAYFKQFVYRPME